jgi:hypothetical protein
MVTKIPSDSVKSRRVSILPNGGSLDAATPSLMDSRTALRLGLRGELLLEVGFSRFFKVGI